jgi:hypothetical protein
VGASLLSTDDRVIQDSEVRGACMTFSQVMSSLECQVPVHVSDDQTLTHDSSYESYKGNAIVLQMRKLRHREDR